MYQMIFCVAAISVVVYWMRDYLRAVALCMRLPGPPGMPIVGHATLLLKPNFLSEFVGPANRIYGRVARAWLFVVPLFVITEPNDIQSILASSKHTDKIFVYRFMHNFLGNGLITSNGENWQTHRRLIQPMFHRQVLERFLGGFLRASENLVKFIDGQNNMDFNITKLINECVLDVLNETIFGVSKFGLVDESSTPFRKGKLMMQFRLTHPWFLLDWMYLMTKHSTAEANHKQNLNTFTKNMIRERQEALQKSQSSTCILDSLIELSKTNPSFTDEDIVEEATTLMLAGQDSVGSAVAFCLLMLAKHPDCQQICRNEVDNLFSEVIQPGLDDFRRLPYLEQCLKETLRMFPSVPLIARRISQPVRLSNAILPTGSNVLIFPYATHRIEHIYPNPETFDPSRFSYEDLTARHPFAYIPYSAGPRNCIGYKFANFEMLTILARILQSFEIHPAKEHLEVKPMFRVSLRASGGIWMRFLKRKHI